ncbi:sodium/proton antiporter [Actinobacillus equuli]|nr:sodium/proton antiporter [Actinobacillus equuli]
MNSSNAIFKSFLGKAPEWYKLAILAFLVINPLVFSLLALCCRMGISCRVYFTLSMALKCYPLQPGGLLAIEAVIIGMTSPHHVKEEIMANFDVIYY